VRGDQHHVRLVAERPDRVEQPLWCLDAEVAVCDTWTSSARCEGGRMVGDADDSDPGAGSLEHARSSRRSLVDARTHDANPGVVEALDRVEQRVDVVVEGVVVRERDAVDAQILQHLHGDWRRAEEERLVRIGPPGPTVRDRALEVEHERISLTDDRSEVVGEQRRSRVGLQTRRHQTSQHRVAGQRQSHGRSTR
jgi:hypothetical protein